MDKSTLIKEFNIALEQEIKHIKDAGGDAKFTLRNGQLIDNYGGKFIYEFITDTPIELDDDTPINIRYGNESVSGNIITINGLKVLLGLNEDAGSKIPEIIITASAYFLLEILQEMINNIDSKKFPFNEDISMKAFGFQKSIVDEDYNFLTPLNELKLPISNEQKDALAKSLGSEVTFIWGPPGTGKTTLLSYLASELLLRNQSILLVSHTNVAIDNALERTAKILNKRKDEKYFNGAVLRIGNPSDKDFFDNYPELDLDYWIEEKGKKLNEELTGLELKLEKETAFLDKLTGILEIFTSFEKTEKKISKIKADIETTKKDLADTNYSISQTKKDINETKNKVEDAKKAGFLGRLFGNNPQKLEKSLNGFFSFLSEESSRLTQLREKLVVQTGNLQNAEEEHKRHQNELIEFSNRRASLKKEGIQQEIEKQQMVTKEIKQQVDAIKNVIQQLGQNIINNAKLIGTTITKGYLNQNIYSRSFDVVVVDEASMAPLPALFFDCGLATSKVIIIGDFRQLAPIAMSDDILAEKWLRKDIFEVAGITKKVNNNEKEERLATLKEQRRMPEEIAELVNRLIYNGNLKSKEKPPIEDKQEKEVIQAKPFPKEKIVLCDTSEFNPWCAKSSIRHSPFNIYSAFLSVYLAEQGLLGGVKDIAILTPYRAQNSLIHKLVVEKGLEGVSPASVHRFQGKESDLVIFDLVEGPIREIRWLGGGLDTEAMRLINVAITRAKAKIIFVANLKYLETKLRSESVLRQVLEDIKKSYPVIDTQKFFPFIRIPIKRVESIKLNDAVPSFCNQAFFYKAFQTDLLRAEDKAIIVSPFLTSNRIASFEPIFRELHRKEVKVFIITKPFNEQKISQEFGREIINNLQKLDIDLITKPLSHEKLAVIDGKVIWHGSLNILSHKNTSELMVRFTTKDNKFSEEALKLCGINISRIIEENVVDKKIQSLNKKGIGFCPSGHPFVIKRGSLGIFLSCSRFPYCKEKAPLILDIIGEIFGKKYLSCEKCGSPMAIKFNPKRKSRFLGCSKYPNCRFTRPL